MGNRLYVNATQYTEAEDKQLMELRSQGLSFSRISRQFHTRRSSSSLSDRYKKLISPSANKFKRRERNYLSWLQQRSLREPWELVKLEYKKITPEQLAASYKGQKYDDIPPRFIEWENRSKRFNVKPVKPDHMSYAGCGLAHLKGSGL